MEKGCKKSVEERKEGERNRKNKIIKTNNGTKVKIHLFFQRASPLK